MYLKTSSLSRILSAVASIVLLSVAIGCSDGGVITPDVPQSLDNLSRPVANPDLPPVESLPAGQGGISHNMAGFWTVAIDRDDLTAEILPVREGMWHFNVTQFIDGPPLNLGISINSAESDPMNGLIDCMVSLTNPFSPTATQLCGFDVRGILFTEGGTAIGGLAIATMDQTRLLNADGHTRWWNPTEFPGSGLLAFTPGALAPDGFSILTATLNPFKYFADSLGEDDPVSMAFDPSLPVNETRGIFKPGETNTRRYTIQFPSDGSGLDLIFNYGVDICWAPPTVKPPVDLPADFPIEANSPEAFLVEVDTTCNTLWYTDFGDRGGELFLNIRVSDWSGKATHDIIEEVDQIRVQCPGVFAGTLTADYRWEDDDFADFTCDVGDYGFPSGAGTFPLIVSVISATGSYDQGFPTAFPPGPVTAYKLVYITINDTPTQPYPLPYVDDMGPNTLRLWDVENGPSHSPPGGTAWGYTIDHWGTAPSLTDTFEVDMDTYLVSPELLVPDSGSLTVRYMRAMQAESSGDVAGGQVMYRINGGSWEAMGGFFSAAYDYDEFSNPIPSQGQNPSLTGLTPGDTIEVGFHFESGSGVPSGFGYHIYRVVAQEWPAIEIDRIDFPQFLGNAGTTYLYQTDVTNASPLTTHIRWLGLDYSTSDSFMNMLGNETHDVAFPAEGKFWVGMNAYLHTPVEWLVSGVGADMDVYSYVPTAGAFFADDFVDNTSGWDLTIGGDINGDFMQIRADGTGCLDNRQGESGCYGEVADGTPSALPKKIARLNLPIPGAIGDGAITYLRLFHRFWMFPMDTVLVRIQGTDVLTASGLHYQSYDPYMTTYGWGWFDSVGSPSLEVRESVICVGDSYNGTSIDLDLVCAPKNEYPNCFTDYYTYGWQVDYVELFQTTDPYIFFMEDFNRGFTFSEGYTYPYDLTIGSDAWGNFWNIVPNEENGYLTNVQINTGCWNGTSLPAVNEKEARLFVYWPHTNAGSEIVVRHRFNAESEGERMWIEVNGTALSTDGGFIYNGAGDYWTGTSGGWVESHFSTPLHPVPGDTEVISFHSLATDEFDNCEGSGYTGWQIDWISVTG